MGSYGRNYNLKQLFTELAFHPNFILPDTPKTLAEVTDYVWESAALFVSPPKYEGEDEVFSSDTLADAIKYGLRDALIQRLKMIAGSPKVICDVLDKIWDIVYAHNKREDIDCIDLANIIRTHSSDGRAVVS